MKYYQGNAVKSSLSAVFNFHVYSGETSHERKTGPLVIPLKGFKCDFVTSYGHQPQKVHSGSFKGTIWGIEQKKKYDRRYVLGVKEF